MSTPYMSRTMLAATALDVWLIENIGQEAFDMLKASGGYVTGGAALAAWWNYEPGDIDVIFERKDQLGGLVYALTTRTSYHLETVNDARPSRAREAILTAEGKAKLDLLYHPDGVFDFNGTVDLSCCRVWYSPQTRSWSFHSPLVGHDITLGIVRVLHPGRTTDERVEKYTERARFPRESRP
jgi:hypothetical protein